MPQLDVRGVTQCPSHRIPSRHTPSGATRYATSWYDENLVSIELVSAKVNITQPSEIALYLAAFEQLSSMAVYGAEARAIIVKALEAVH